MVRGRTEAAATGYEGAFGDGVSVVAKGQALNAKFNATKWVGKAPDLREEVLPAHEHYTSFEVVGMGWTFKVKLPPSLGSLVNDLPDGMPVCVVLPAKVYQGNVKPKTDDGVTFLSGPPSLLMQVGAAAA